MYSVGKRGDIAVLCRNFDIIFKHNIYIPTKMDVSRGDKTTAETIRKLQLNFCGVISRFLLNVKFTFDVLHVYGL